jgi:DNA-binding NarL/FixJ family response regulator
VTRKHLGRTGQPASDHDGTPNAGLALLTSREREVLRLTALGLTAHEIGKKLFISKRTVESHRDNMRRKLALRNMVELVRFAIRNGL